VELSDRSAVNAVTSWRVGREPLGVSVNTACNLLVACLHANVIQEYTTTGSLIREICLKSREVVFRPLHAIQLHGDQYVVSYWSETGKVFDVVEVNGNGRVLVSYTNRLQSTTQHRFDWPRHLSVDRKNDCILVADSDNNRVVILNRSLNCSARELNVTEVEDGLKTPSCLHYDTVQNRLFVGEQSGQRVLMFDNVI
jgi:hypothetical protein